MRYRLSMSCPTRRASPPSARPVFGHRRLAERCVPPQCGHGTRESGSPFSLMGASILYIGTHYVQIVTHATIQPGARRVATGLLRDRASLESARVALLVAPGAAFVEALYGVLWARGCAVVLSTLHPPAETA